MSKFDIKDKLDNALYSIYNTLTEAAFNLKPFVKREIKKNIQFKDKHLGQQCFILGTGPSLNLLTEKQISLLEREIVFGTNSLYKANVVSRLTPMYYSLLDNLYWEQWSHTFKDVVNCYQEKLPTFITDLRAKSLVEQSNPMMRHIYVYSKKYPVDRMSDQLDKNIYAAMNVVSYSILAASYMGFKKIFLLGCDYNSFCTHGRGHAYNDNSELSQSRYNLAFYLRFYWITTEFHYLIEKLARSKGVEVINLTPSSLLDAYRKDSLDRVLEKIIEH